MSRKKNELSKKGGFCFDGFKCNFIETALRSKTEMKIIIANAHYSLIKIYAHASN